MRLRIAGLLTVASLALPGCTPEWATKDQSQMLLQILRITGTSGSTGETGDFLNSDVSPVFNDNATLSMRATQKNPFALLPTLGINDIIVERYEVRYIRSDGRNTEGVDVPYRISGPLAATVPAGAEATVTFVVVRHQAKLEPPLRNLRGVVPQNSTSEFGGAAVLTVIAEITVHGRDGAGHAVQATGRLQINFADFLDQP